MRDELKVIMRPNVLPCEEKALEKRGDHYV